MMVGVTCVRQFSSVIGVVVAALYLALLYVVFVAFRESSWWRCIATRSTGVRASTLT